MQHKSTKSNLILQPLEIQYVPIKKTLHSIFHNRETLQIAQNYIASKTLGILTDLKDGEYWKHKLDQTHLPFILFFDDYESGNPLGSNKGEHKIGAVYLSMRCFPTK